MITIPDARENMTKGELRLLVVEMAKWIQEQDDRYAKCVRDMENGPHPLEEQVQDQMEQGLAKAQETMQERPKWSAGRIPNNLTNRQGIQWPVEKLDEKMREEIIGDDPTLLDNLGK